MAWIRFGGTSRNYYNDDYTPDMLGSKARPLSRRQYDNFRTAIGTKRIATPKEKLIQRVKQNAYNRHVKNYVDTKREQGERITLREARNSPEVRAIAKSFKRLDKTVKTPSGKTTKFRDTPDGRRELRDDLIALGRRTTIPNWVPPGLSSRFRAGKLRKDRIPKKFTMTM
jgi:hypothetical protein